MPRESTGERVGGASERVGLQPPTLRRLRATDDVMRRRVGAAGNIFDNRNFKFAQTSALGRTRCLVRARARVWVLARNVRPPTERVREQGKKRGEQRDIDSLGTYRTV